MQAITYARYGDSVFVFDHRNHKRAEVMERDGAYSIFGNFNFGDIDLPRIIGVRRGLLDVESDYTDHHKSGKKAYKDASEQSMI